MSRQLIILNLFKLFCMGFQFCDEECPLQSHRGFLPVGRWSRGHVYTMLGWAKAAIPVFFSNHYWLSAVSSWRSLRKFFPSRVSLFRAIRRSWYIPKFSDCLLVWLGDSYDRVDKKFSGTYLFINWTWICPNPLTICFHYY